jgi:aspartate 1-decarboxylase
MDRRKKSPKDDIIIIISYATLEFEEAKTFKPDYFSK